MEGEFKVEGENRKKRGWKWNGVYGEMEGGSKIEMGE